MDLDDLLAEGHDYDEHFPDPILPPEAPYGAAFDHWLESQSKTNRTLAALMGCEPRVWVGKGDRPCTLVVTCPGCGKPSFVADPEGAQMAACAFCGVTGKAPDEAISAWRHHKSVCKCDKVDSGDGAG